jgi:cell division protein FtsL
MGRLNLFVSVLLMLSAISLVTARYQARQLFIELDRSRAQARELDIRWRQLQLDRAELARNAHVDQVAREELRMQSIVPERTIYINQAVVPAAGTSGGGR